MQYISIPYSCLSMCLLILVTTVRTTTLEEQLAKYEREVEMLLQKRVAQLTAEEPHVKGEQERFSLL